LKTLRKTLYIDMALGTSGDMFSAACCAFMGEALREEFLRRIIRSCQGLGGSMELRESCCGSERGYTVAHIFPKGGKGISAREASEMIERIARDLGLSAKGKEYAMSIFSDIVSAEAKAHGVGIDAVHLHEIGRPAGLINIASAGLCYDLLELGERKAVGSVISTGRGRVSTEHGWLSVPTPASANLLAMMRSRPGPFDGEMATPTGIAIMKNLISKQIDDLPIPGRQGVGFGSKSFEGVVGYIRLFEKGESVNEGV